VRGRSGCFLGFDGIVSNDHGVFNGRDFNRGHANPPGMFPDGVGIFCLIHAGGASSLSRIGDEVGYESVAAFSRAFKRATGMPPATWRAQAVMSSTVKTMDEEIRGNKTTTRRFLD